MNCLDIFRMIVSPSPSHAFGLNVVRHDIVVIRKSLAANRAFPVLLDDLSV